MSYCRQCGKKTLFSDCCPACKEKKRYKCRLCEKTIPSFGLCENCKNQIYEEIKAIKEKEYDGRQKKEKEKRERWREEEIEKAKPEREKEEEMRREIRAAYSIHHFSYEQIKTQLRELARKLFQCNSEKEAGEREADDGNRWEYHLVLDVPGYYHTENYYTEVQIELSKEEIKEDGIYQYIEAYQSKDYRMLMAFDEYLKHYISVDMFDIIMIPHSIRNDVVGERRQYRVKLSTSDDPNSFLYANVTYIEGKID